MKKQLGFAAALCVVFAGFCCAAPGPATAQEPASGATPPPNVLVIQREFLKPGKAGSPHENTERAFVQLSAQANSAHYLAMDSLSGRSRALFLFGYKLLCRLAEGPADPEEHTRLGAGV
ncbi:MAG: hypothetical protein ACRD28_02025 [Acidobacteriaceae bacterium]